MCTKSGDMTMRGPAPGGATAGAAAAGAVVAPGAGAWPACWLQAVTAPSSSAPSLTR